MTQLKMPEFPPTIVDPYNNVTYRQGKMLGKGGFAYVFEFEDVASGATYACKITPRSSLHKKKYYDKFVSEVSIHRGLNHPNVVKLINVFKDNLNYYMIMEKCAAGSLTDLIRRRKHLTELETRFFTARILDALGYMHDLLIIHRDLKTSNIFLTADFDLRVGDFGLAVKCESPQELHWTMCGTPNFLPVEIIYSHITKRRNSGREPDPHLDAECIALCERCLPPHVGQGHSFASDMWSLGCLIYSMVYGRPPFEAQDIKTTYKRIIQCNYSFPDSIRVSEDFKAFIRGLLNPDPTQRFTVRDCLKHRWLTRDVPPLPQRLPSSIVTTPYEPPTGLAGSAQLSKSPSRQMRPDHLGVGPVGPGAGDAIDTPQAIGTWQKFPNSKTGGAGGAGDMQSPSLGSGARRKGTALSSTNLLQPGSIPAAPTSGLGGVGGGIGAGVNKYGINEAEFPQILPPCYIMSWVDYSNRYGFAYQISNGSIGVIFNDESAAILSPNAVIVDYSPNLVDGAFERALFTDGLTIITEKKYKLLSFFRDYLENRSIVPIPGSDRPHDDVELCRLVERDKAANVPVDLKRLSKGIALPQLFLKKWKLYDDGTLCLLFNTKVFQVNFSDHTKVVVAHRSVTFMNEKREIFTYPSEYLKDDRFAFKELRRRVDRARKYYEVIKVARPVDSLAQYRYKDTAKKDRDAIHSVMDGKGPDNPLK
ncbi:Kinase, PLK [Giardia muris]|uniref:Serine/threonine-protein kinase PLK n=1 Tax=Giardia muris TaxID=5742 RepID=A0A4Z1T867_GIAMU|nr:Kinase, PLK [Giardia muris]|eukprot:TNJ28779.1 Kinase, PLK [Giardia muris]